MDYRIKLKDAPLEKGELQKLYGILVEFTHLAQYHITPEPNGAPVLIIPDSNDYMVSDVMDLLRDNGYPRLKQLSAEPTAKISLAL